MNNIFNTVRFLLVGSFFIQCLASRYENQWRLVLVVRLLCIETTKGQYSSLREVHITPETSATPHLNIVDIYQGKGNRSWTQLHQPPWNPTGRSKKPDFKLGTRAQSLVKVGDWFSCILLLSQTEKMHHTSENLLILSCMHFLTCLPFVTYLDFVAQHWDLSRNDILQFASFEKAASIRFLSWVCTSFTTVAIECH